MFENTNNDNLINNSSNLIPEIFKTEVTYFDKDWNPMTKNKGSKIRITELDKDGNIVNEVWGDYEKDLSK